MGIHPQTPAPRGSLLSSPLSQLPTEQRSQSTTRRP